MMFNMSRFIAAGVWSVALELLWAWLAFCTACQATAQQPYRVERSIVLGNANSWDYMTVDNPSQRLYISHETEVLVVDLKSGKVIGAISGLVRCHTTVILPGGATGFISDGGGNRVIVFDPNTLAKLGEIPAGTNPDGMVYEGATQTIWAFNGKSKNATVIDVASRKLVATLPVPGKPEFPVTDDQGTIFVNLENNVVLRVDARARKITANWPLKGCEAPSGQAIDRAGARLFAVCDGKKMTITDAHTGKSLGLANIGEESDAAGYDPKNNLAFASNQDGTLSVIDASKPSYPTVQTLRTTGGARTMTLDAVTGKIYTVGGKLGGTPPPSALVSHPRPVALPGTFSLLVIGR